MPDQLYVVEPPADAYVVEDCPDGSMQVEHTEQECVVIREVVVQEGEPGEPGPPATSESVQLVANGPISGHRVITTDLDGKAIYADPTTMGHVHGPFMVSTNAAADGDIVIARLGGEVLDGGWSWTPRSALYLGANGTLTDVPPTSPSFEFAVVVAVAESPDKIIVQPRPTIVLAD